MLGELVLLLLLGAVVVGIVVVIGVVVAIGVVVVGVVVVVVVAGVDVVEETVELENIINSVLILFHYSKLDSILEKGVRKCSSTVNCLLIKI